MMGLMSKISTASGRKGALTILLPFCALAFGAAEPALARQCPRGEYLRVSKGICVPKADAHRKLGGGYRHGGGLAAPAGMEVIHSEASTAYATVKGPPGSDNADDAVKGVKAATKADPSASPYGALDLQSFAKPRQQ
jgi:hypothetical protein